MVVGKKKKKKGTLVLPESRLRWWSDSKSEPRPAIAPRVISPNFAITCETSDSGAIKNSISFCFFISFFDDVELDLPSQQPGIPSIPSLLL
jgi:hypothetical protein